LGALTAGSYEIDATVTFPDGTAAALSQTFGVEARGSHCNPDPLHNVVQATLKSNDLVAFEQRLATDAAYRARLGDVAVAGVSYYIQLAFPELRDPIRIMGALNESGDFTNIHGYGLTCFTTPPADGTARLVEYRNTIT